jgi:hypothetical protein
MVLLAATEAPLPIAVALVKPTEATSESYPISVLFVPVVFKFPAS